MTLIAILFSVVNEDEIVVLALAESGRGSEFVKFLVSI